MRYLSDIQIYDVNRDRWDSFLLCPCINRARRSFNVFIYNHHLYVMNGKHDTEIWNLNTRKCIIQKTSPKGLNSQKSILFHNSIYTFDNNQTTSILNLDNNYISKVKGIPITYIGLSNIEALNTKIYINILPLTSSECFIEYDPNTEQFNRLNYYDVFEQDFTTTHCNNVLYVSGGQSMNMNTTSDKLLRWDPRCKKIYMCNPMSISRWGHGMEAIESNSTLIVMGGETGYTDALSSCELYDIRTDRWRPMASMNSSRVDFGTTVIWT